MTKNSAAEPLDIEITTDFLPPGIEARLATWLTKCAEIGVKTEEIRKNVAAIQAELEALRC